MNTTAFILLMLFFAICAGINTTNALRSEYKNVTCKIVMYVWCGFMWLGILALVVLAVMLH